MSFKQYRIIFILIFMLASGGTHLITAANDIDTNNQQHVMTNDMENAQSDPKEGRALFPRLEYTNEWTPVGRGDPLKDPTYDYMPPVLDRVRYWAEGTSNKNKNEILVLGVPSKKMTPANKKNTYGPIKRTYYSMPYQSHFPPPAHHQQQPQQQQQYHPQRLVPPQRMHVTLDSHPMMSTHHYNQNQQPYHPTPPRKNLQNGNNNIYQVEHRPDFSIHSQTALRQHVTTIPTRHPSSVPFLPTIPPMESSSSPLANLNVKDHLSSPPTPPMSLMPSIPNISMQNTTNNEMIPSTTIRPITMALNEQNPFGSSSTMTMNTHSNSKETTKPLLHSILQTESAVPFSFTKKPSSTYQIEYTSNIYSPEAINSMAASSTTTFIKSSTTIRPATPVKTTNKMTISTSERDENKHYVQPDMHVGWPVYNLIIEGHSKVKTYGLKNDDPLALSMPKIRPVQAKENPIVEHVTNNGDDGPEYKVQKSMKKESTMENLLSILDGSFSNLLTTSNSNGNGENKSHHKGNRRKTRSIADVNDVDVNNKEERVVGVSFQVDERPQLYRKGTVISESMWPFENNADTSR